MKNLAIGSLILSLGLFLTGCQDTAKQKDTSKRTVTTDQQTGETKVKEEEQHTQTNSDTGAKEETSVEKETTSKPPQENGKAEGANETAPPNDNAADTNTATP